MFKFKDANLDYVSKLVVGYWGRHERAMEEAPLLYLDHLLNSLAREYGEDPVTLAKKLHAMVPGLHYGTARRLVRLKFGPVEASTDCPGVVTRYLEN